MEEHREFVARFQQTGEEMRLGLDFGKKHGLIEAMHKSIKAADDSDDPDYEFSGNMFDGFGIRWGLTFGFAF